MERIPSREYWQALLSKKSPTILVLAVLVGLAIRVPGMDRSLGHDEAFTLEAFSSQPYARIATSYSAPNNHIFHSLLVRLSTRSLGKENWTARLPALAAGVAAIPVIWAVGRALCGTSAVGLVSAWILALIPVHQHYSQASRGYSLLMLLGLLSLWAAQSGVRQGRRRSWAAFGICSFLMAWAIPSGIFHLNAADQRPFAPITTPGGIALGHSGFTRLCAGVAGTGQRRPAMGRGYLAGSAGLGQRLPTSSRKMGWGLERPTTSGCGTGRPSGNNPESPTGRTLYSAELGRGLCRRSGDRRDGTTKDLLFPATDFRTGRSIWALPCHQRQSLASSSDDRAPHWIRLDRGARTQQCISTGPLRRPGHPPRGLHAGR